MTDIPVLTGFSTREIFYWILYVSAVYFFIPWLRREAQRAQSEKAAHEAARKVTLRDHLNVFIWTTADSMAEDRFPKLAQKVLDGKLRTSEQIKAELYGWGDDLKRSAIEAFKVQGVDLIREFGDKYIDNIIEYAANAHSPLPGMETSKALSRVAVAQEILQKGVDLTQAELREVTCRGCIPSCEGCKGLNIDIDPKAAVTFNSDSPIV